ncbi:DUF1194 domain-containing protein [Aestuariibius sp. HNIBRBA575]|uniref:DUF1194 domain-containing protein n=1 Tax=Aestuariibius sp. HNIBRBA575 TaxID=3233343 RepID=UPI0034A265DD
MFKLAISILFCFVTSMAQACSTALLLMIDVSNSIDEGEYRLQTDGLADALLDPEIMDEIIAGQVAMSVMQWSGQDRQMITQPWTILTNGDQVREFALIARTTPRAFALSDTAPGNALSLALDQMENAPDCHRKIIDVSGDGTANSGIDVRPLRTRAERMGVTVNGIAIEGMGLTITVYFHRSIITRDGFVITARGHREYPDAIRRKILREVARIFG